MRWFVLIPSAPTPGAEEAYEVAGPFFSVDDAEEAAAARTADGAFVAEARTPAGL